jgi:protein-S-isoprenylcysteine O-methyltransferase Ste14
MKRIMPPTFFLGAIILAAILHFLLPGRRIFFFPWRWLGLFPLIVGIILNLLADQLFKNHNTAVKPFEEPKAMIIDGVFGISRNPMYLGMILIMLGIAVILGSVAPFAVAFILAVLFDRVFIAAEERILEDTFGDRFRQYRQQVRKWL